MVGLRSLSTELREVAAEEGNRSVSAALLRSRSCHDWTATSSDDLNIYKHCLFKIKQISFSDSAHLLITSPTFG